MDLLTETQMDGVPAVDQAKKAIIHVLRAIKADERKRDVMGFGTQSFSLLTEAAATLCGEPVQKVREFYSE